MASNPYDQPFSQSSDYASGNTSFSTRGRSASGRSVKVNPYNQSFNATGDAPNQDYSKPSASNKPSNNNSNNNSNNTKQNQPQKSQNIFQKIGNFGKSLAVDAAHTGAKVANTVAVPVAAATGSATAGIQKLSGDSKGANATMQATADEIKNIRTHGAGNQGGFYNPDKIKAAGGNPNSAKERYLKSTSQAVAEVAPWVLPIGKTVKGASLLTKVARGAVDNAAVNGATTVGNEAIQGRLKTDNGTELAKNVALSGIIGGAVPLIHGGLATGAEQAAKVTKAATGKDAAANSLITNTKTHAALDSVKNITHLPENHTAYFEMGKHTPTVPIEHLNLTKPADEQMHSVTNAEKLMNDASFGNAPKRAPVLVHVGKDGAHTVLDGNATTAVAEKHGWQTIPVDRVTSEHVPTPAHVDSINMLHERAKAENPAFQATLSDIAKQQGMEYHPGDVKTPGRALTKAMDDYGGDHTALKDTIRGTMVLHDHSPEGIQRAVDAIKQAYPDATVKNGYERHEGGYRDVKVNVKTPNGHTGEVILAAPEMLQAKHEMGGHDLYRQARDMTVPAEQRAAAEQKMLALYEQAHASANSRLASSSDLPNLETKTANASAGDTSLPASSRKPGLVTPDNTEVSVTPRPSGEGRTASTTSSSEMKNLGISSIPSTVADSAENVKHNLNGSGEATTPKTSESHAAAQATKPKESVSGETSTTTLTPSQTAHMPEIGGYTHSSEMAKDYAEMLRGQEQQAKGGQMVQHPDGTYTRVSEHSKFYRAIYKETGRPPTKADYLEEAKLQLESGRAMHDASVDYKKLLERESKPVPRVQIESSVTDTPKGTAKVASRILKTLKDKYSDAAQYDKINLKDQAEKASKLMANREELNKVISGEKPLPDGLRSTALIAAVRHDPELMKDGELLKKIANSPLASEASYSAQELRLARENADGDPIEAIKQVQKARQAAAERRAGKSVDEIYKEAKKTVAAAKPKVTKETWSSFVESIQC